MSTEEQGKKRGQDYPLYKALKRDATNPGSIQEVPALLSGAAMQGYARTFECNHVDAGIGLSSNGKGSKTLDIPIVMLTFTSSNGTISPVINLSLGALAELLPILVHASDTMLQLMRLVDKEDAASVEQFIQDSLDKLNKNMPSAEYAKHLHSKMLASKSAQQ